MIYISNMNNIVHYCVYNSTRHKIVTSQSWNTGMCRLLWCQVSLGPPNRRCTSWCKRLVFCLTESVSSNWMGSIRWSIAKEKAFSFDLFLLLSWCTITCSESCPSKIPKADKTGWEWSCCCTVWSRLFSLDYSIGPLSPDRWWTRVQNRYNPNVDK